MTSPTRLWKVTGPNGEACHGGTFAYDLPRWSRTKGWIPGKWTPRVSVDPCRTGYHVCRDQDLLNWCNGARIWAVETRGVTVVHEDGGTGSKVVAESVRLLCPTPWDDVTARLFAVDVAAAALPFFEKVRPDDLRVSDCLEVAHRYALGDATVPERDAARAAAWVAAWDAARDAAWAAAGAAAWAAARDATRDAARDAAWDAAGAAARDAAWAAARDAAWAAARAAAKRRQTAVLLWWLGATTEYPDD